MSRAKDTIPALYDCWRNMRTRCNNPAYRDYHRYGGRGIRVCKRWDDYRAFERWALKNGYVPGLTIERRNNAKGYSPQNCCWADRTTQANNEDKVLKAPCGTPYHIIAARNGITRSAWVTRRSRG